MKQCALWVAGSSTHFFSFDSLTRLPEHSRTHWGSYHQLLLKSCLSERPRALLEELKVESGKRKEHLLNDLSNDHHHEEFMIPVNLDILAVSELCRAVFSAMIMFDYVVLSAIRGPRPYLECARNALGNWSSKLQALGWLAPVAQEDPGNVDAKPLPTPRCIAQQNQDPDNPWPALQRNCTRV